jgi:hypothetical protein
MWGPVGLGNGPLWVVRGGDFGWGEPQTGATAVAYVVPVGNTGPGVAVIDGVSVISSARSAPAILRQALIGRMTGYDCTSLGPFGPYSSALAGCVRPLLRSAAGAVLPGGISLTTVRKGGGALVLKLAAPPSGACWDLISVVVRYHVGIRHYAGTFPQGDNTTCRAGEKAAGPA